MFFRSPFQNRRNFSRRYVRRGYVRRGYARSGFRLRSNTLVWLLIFFLIGLFLHYGGRTQPVVAFWNDFKRSIGLRPSPTAPEERNPYKVPEPDEASADEPTRREEGVATAEGPQASASEQRTSSKLFPFEKQVDFLLPAFSGNDEIIRHDGYVLRYRDTYEQADWVAYPLLENEVFGDAERDYAQFRPDPMVESGTALPTDYTRSGYDRGHLAPAGDFKFSQRLMRESFYMSNVSPQAPQFNRGIWKELEEQVRAWAVRDGGLYVVTGPVLRPGLPTIGKQNEVAVPEYFYKVILYCRNPEIRIIAFLMRNEASDNSLKQFVVPVDEVEKMTGIDFFPKIPDPMEQELERTSPRKAISQWFSF